MSPEQAQGNKAVDYRSDLWSLGVIAFECIVGKRPFFSDGLGDLVLTICVRDLPVPSDFAPVPLGFDAWFARACAREPAQRFQSARELTEGLRDALGIEGLSADTPEIVVNTDGPKSSASATSETPTVIGDSVALSSGARRRADPEALTLAAGEADVAAPTEALFGTTHAHAPEPRNNTSIVFMVAGAALAAGIVGGFLFLRKSVPVADELDTRTSFVPAASASTPVAAEPPPVPREEEKHAADAAVEPAPHKDAGTDAAGPDASPADAAAVGAEAGVAERVAPPSTPETEGPATDGSAPPVPDPNWQKPDWAKPDNEIPVRRGPGEADDTIVIPKDE
jgi:serine/threonine-protein kinase